VAVNKAEVLYHRKAPPGRKSYYPLSMLIA